MASPFGLGQNLSRHGLRYHVPGFIQEKAAQSLLKFFSRAAGMVMRILDLTVNCNFNQ
jgi:hypothetical protein